MKTNFFREIKRIDRRQASNETFTIRDELKQWEVRVRNTSIGKLAFDLDSHQNKFRNDSLWYLYIDDSVEIEADLASCLAHLELDNTLNHDFARLLATNFFQESESINSLEPEDYYNAVDEIQNRYYQTIVSECYEHGYFGTSSWTIEDNSISSRFK